MAPVSARNLKVKLKVQQSKEADVYRDLARIPEQFRKDHRGHKITEGSICQVQVGEHRALVILRGSDSQEPIVRLDERIRNRLGVENDQAYEFRLSKGGPCTPFRWAWRASDPAYQVAARLAALSVALGIIGVLLGLIAFCKK